MILQLAGQFTECKYNIGVFKIIAEFEMDKFEEEVEEIIEHKITKVNGEVGYKKYSKGKLLGKGGFAKCYEGMNLQTKQMFAIKVIDKATLQRSRAKQKLLSQIKIHKTLHHKHIVQFDSVFQDTKNVYIVLELCTNKTLSEMVKKRKKLTVKQARYFMLQIVSALQYMHSNRVIHRDLKMGNIFLNQNMDLKVGDFGLATKLQFCDEKKRTMCGTPNYIAPEIVEGAIGHSYEVDIWSTGVICYALMFGRPPFETNQVKMTYKKIKTCDYQFPNISVPEEVKDFIKKILVLDPKQRLTVKQMYEHPFLNCEDIPKYIPVEALTTIPNFKSSGKPEEVGPSLIKVKSTDKLKAQDFTKKKLELNLNNNGSKLPIDGMHSPRNVFNTELTQKKQPETKQPLEKQKQEQHKITVLVSVDYSKKYGLGYLLNNKQYGVYFNDETLMSTDLQTKKVYYIDNPAGKDDSLVCYTPEKLPVNKDFQKKHMLLERFIPQLNDEASKLPESKLVYHKNDCFIYMKQWLKTRHAIMFGLSHKIFQVNFFDNSQILLNTQKKTVLFFNKKGQKTYQSLANALQTSDSQMARRIKYTKQILNSIRQRREDRQEEVQDIEQRT